MKNRIGNKSQLGICLHNTNVGYKEKSEVGSPVASGDVQMRDQPTHTKKYVKLFML